jgi:hypothetical protein
MIMSIVDQMPNGGKRKMIILKQLPLGELNTFEEELLFFLAGKVLSIKGDKPRSIVGPGTIAFCRIILVDGVQLNLSDFAVSIVNLFTKYNKCFRGKFEILLKKGINNRWELKIEE